MKLTLTQIDLAIAQREWPDKSFVIIGGSLCHSYKWSPTFDGKKSRIRNDLFTIDPNALWPIMVRDGLWPQIISSANSGYHLKVMLGGWPNSNEWYGITHKDPLIAAKLAYCKKHGLFEGEEIEVIE